MGSIAEIDSGPTATRTGRLTANSLPTPLDIAKVTEASFTQDKAQTKAGLHIFVELLPVIGLFWLFLVVRLINIERLPYFIDELHHITRARIVWSFSDIHVSTTPSKFLLYYYLGLFDLPANLPGWMARTPVALFGMVGAASMFAVTRMLFSRSAGLLAIVILTVFPFMVFHERMALTDPFAASLAMLTVWWILHYIQKPTRRRTLILAILLCLMLAAKILTAPLLMMPVAAIALLSTHRFEAGVSLKFQMRKSWSAYRPSVLLIARIVMGTWFVIVAFYVGRGLTNPAQTEPIVDDYIYEAPSRLDVIAINMEHYAEVFQFFWGPLLILLTAVGLLALLRWRWRIALFLLTGIVPLWGLLSVAAARPNSRYLTIVGHLWVIIVAGGLYVLTRQIADWTNREHPHLQILTAAPIGMALIWAVFYGGTYSWHLAEDPLAVQIPEREINGYFRNLTGYGFVDAMTTVEALPPISEGYDRPVLAGAVRVCDYLPYHMPADANLTIVCLGERHLQRLENINALLKETGALYLMREDFFLTQVDPKRVQGYTQWIATFERPYDGVDVYLYRVLLRDPQLSGVQQP